jgi:hypothetical protein
MNRFLLAVAFLAPLGVALASEPPAAAANPAEPAKAEPAAAAPKAPEAPPPIFPSVQIDIEPGSDSGTFLATARVFDLNSRRILAGPQFVIQQGTPGNAEVEGPGGTFKVRIEAGVDPTGTSAQWSYAITEQGVLIAESRGTVTLSRPREAGY